MTFEEYKDNYLKRWQKRMVKYFIIIFAVHTLATALLNVSFLFSKTFSMSEFIHHMVFRTLMPCLLQAIVLCFSILYLLNLDKPTKTKCQIVVFDFFWIMTVMAFVQSKYTLFMVFPSISMILAAILTEKRMLRFIFVTDLILIPAMITTACIVYSSRQFTSYNIVSTVSLICSTILIYFISKEILRAQNSHIEFMRHNYNRQVALTEELQIEPLTKLYNRLAYTNTSEKLLKLISNPSYSLENSPATIVFFDLDNFKEINDKFGHATGDSVLVALGKAIITVMETNRNSFRYGGDEFILILRDLSISESIEKVEQIMSEFKKFSAQQLMNKSECTMSVGISMYKKGWTLKDWFKSADEAAYKAKLNGKDRYEIAE